MTKEAYQKLEKKLKTFIKKRPANIYSLSSVFSLSSSDLSGEDSFVGLYSIISFSCDTGRCPSLKQTLPLSRPIPG